jgi:hypothetical protein
MSMLLSRCLAKNYVTHDSKPIFLSVAKLLNFAPPSSCYSHLSFSSLFFCTAALKYCDGAFGWAIMWREREKDVIISLGTFETLRSSKSCQELSVAQSPLSLLETLFLQFISFIAWMSLGTFGCQIRHIKKSHCEGYSLFDYVEHVIAPPMRECKRVETMAN